MNLLRSAALVVFSMALVGCGLTSLLGVTVVASEPVTAAPNDVRVVVTVSDGAEPIFNLTEANFGIYENGIRLDRSTIDLELLPKDTLIQGWTVLLLDISGNPDDATLRRIERGAAHFVEKVSATQPVTIVAFDGSARPREVARFSRVDRPTERSVPPLRSFMSADSSRDLNSALLSAIKGIDIELSKSNKKGQFGTIVTVLRGPDLAGRTSEKEIKGAIASSNYEFYSMSPEDESIAGLSYVGKTGRYHFATIDTLPMRMTDLGIRVRSVFGSHYVLSYCSPARAGERKLKVVVDYESSTAPNKRGSATERFDATGFSGGCREAKAPQGQASPSSSPQLSQSRQSPENTGGSLAPGTGPAERQQRIVAPPDSGKYE